MNTLDSSVVLAGRCALVALGLAAAPLWALDPALPPSGNFDLSNWNLTLPVDSTGGSAGTPVTISTADLQGYTDSWFYTGFDGAMVFRCPAVGASTSGSSHPRTEFRELLNPRAGIVNWTADGTHSMTGSVRINALDPHPYGNVSFAQVHGYANKNTGFGRDDPFILLKYDATKSPAEVWASVRYLVGGAPDPNHSNRTGAHLSFGTAPLGATIGYRIEIRNGTAFIRVSGTSAPEAEKEQSVNFYENDPAWKGVPFYFKAGNYHVGTDGSSDARLSYYRLEKSHLVLRTDDFTGSNAATERARWFAQTASKLNVAGSALVLSPACTALTYFTGSTPIDLGPNETLQATFQLTVQGSSLPATNDVFRVALLNSCSTVTTGGGDPNHATSPQRVSADGYAVTGSMFDHYSGYMVGVNLNPATNDAMKIYTRTPATKPNNGVLGTGSYTQIGVTGGEGPNRGFTPDTIYTGTLTIHRFANGTVNATLTFIGTGGAYWRYRLTDTVGSTPTYTFDTLGFYLGSGGGLTSVTLDNLAVTYSTTPPPL
ncbi:MAG TPA: polysaccharide lyase family 7 protein [Opitutaceae bacterium]